MENINVVQKKGLSSGARITLVYVVSIVLGVILASSLAKIYISIFRPNKLLRGDILSFNIDPNHLADGFLIGYIFFLSFFVALFLKNPKHRFWTWFAGIILFLLITLWDLKYFGFNLLVSLAGYLVGLGVLAVKNRMTHVKSG